MTTKADRRTAEVRAIIEQVDALAAGLEVQPIYAGDGEVIGFAAARRGRGPLAPFILEEQRPPARLTAVQRWWRENGDTDPRDALEPHSVLDHIEGGSWV